MSFTFTYLPRTARPPCPHCGIDLPTSADSPSAFRLEVRKGGTRFRCVLRACYCGLDTAIDQTREDRWGYSFKCRKCGRYEAELPFSAQCTRCFMRGSIGLHDPVALIAGVREAESFIPASREDMLDALIKGLLKGVPGLTIDDGQAA